LSPGTLQVTQSHERLEEGAEAQVIGRCAVAADVLSRIGDKWTVLVVMLLSDGPKRFNELKRLIGGISQRMLTLTLRGLEWAARIG